jgi:hypothetical protein
MLLRLADTLESLAISEEHAPRKAARVVRQLNDLWRDKASKYAKDMPPVPMTTHGGLYGYHQPTTISYAVDELERAAAAMNMETSRAGPPSYPADLVGVTTPSLAGFDEELMPPSTPWQQPGNAEVKQDTSSMIPDPDEFWQSFMATINAIGPGTGF